MRTPKVKQWHRITFAKVYGPTAVNQSTPEVPVVLQSLDPSSRPVGDKAKGGEGAQDSRRTDRHPKEFSTINLSRQSIISEEGGEGFDVMAILRLFGEFKYITRWEMSRRHEEAYPVSTGFADDVKRVFVWHQWDGAFPNRNTGGTGEPSDALAAHAVTVGNFRHAIATRILPHDALSRVVRYPLHPKRLYPILTGLCFLWLRSTTTWQMVSRSVPPGKVIPPICAPIHILDHRLYARVRPILEKDRSWFRLNFPASINGFIYRNHEDPCLTIGADS